jgi:hypothetical protein
MTVPLATLEVYRNLAGVIREDLPCCTGSIGRRRFSQPGGNVTLTVYDTPDIDMIGLFEIEHEVGIALQFPAPEARNAQLVSVAR